jgi:hypothetical protein
MTAMRMTIPITTNQMVVLDDSSAELDAASDESPPDDAWVVPGAAVVVAASVVVGASVVSLPDSSPDEAVVETRLAPVSPSSLHADARTTVPTITSAIA